MSTIETRQDTADTLSTTSSSQSNEQVAWPVLSIREEWTSFYRDYVLYIYIARIYSLLFPPKSNACSQVKIQLKYKHHCFHSEDNLENQ